jgi:hypothetical protein
MLVYKVMITQGDQVLGDVKVELTRDQFCAVTQGGCALWPEIYQAFECEQPDLRADAVLDPNTYQWLKDLPDSSIDQYYPSIAKEPGYW